MAERLPRTWAGHGVLPTHARPAGREVGLAAFARSHPRVAHRLVGASVVPEAFPGVLLEKLDRAVRSGTVDRSLLRLVATFGRLHSGSDWGYFVDSLLVDAAAATRHRAATRSLRSLWGTTPIVNIIPCSKADRLLGVRAETVVLTTYRITSEFDVVLKDQDEWFIANAGGMWSIYRWVLLAWALLSYDVFFYFNDRGLLPAGGYGSDRFGINADEMRLIRLSGKCLYTLAYGADHRSRSKTFMEGWYSLCMACPEIGKFCLCDERSAEKTLGKIAANANAMLGAGLSLAQLPNPRRIDYLILDVGRFEPAYPAPVTGRPLRVVHLPNHPFFKGTQYLEAAVAALAAQDVKIELVMVSGVSNEEAIRLMASADVVADQFIAGSLGYTAIEAMALGKPVLCFLRDDVPLPDREHLPIINTNPDTLYETLRDLASDPSVLPEIGRRSREYAELNYSIEGLAGPLLALYRDTSAFGNVVSPDPAAERVHRERRRRIGRARRYRRLRAAFRAQSDRVGHIVETECRRVGGVLKAVPRRVGRVLKAVPRRVAAAIRHALTLGKRVSVTLMAYARDPRRAVAETRGLARSAVKAALLVAFRIPVPLPIRLARLLTAMRMRLGRIRTLWGVTPILTLPLLARCDRLLGMRSDSLVFTTYYISSRFDINLKRLHVWLVRDHQDRYENFTRWIFAWALLRYDIFHLFYDRGVMNPQTRMGISRIELETLRAAGKRLYTYAYGADVRTRDRTLSLGEFNLCAACPQPGLYCQCDDQAGEANVRSIASYATAMIAMGDMLAYVPGARDLHYWPIDTARLQPAFVSRSLDRPFRVAHAPNHPYFKGTAYLEAAIARLQSEGIGIELVRVQGVPNEQVLVLFSGVDLVADQFIDGFHGYTTLEAMALGKPVLCFLRGPTMAINYEECPIINADPHTLYDVLRDCATGKYDLDKLGRRSRAYVERYYSVESVAARLAKLYLDTAGFPKRSASRLRVRSARLPGLPAAPSAA